MRRLTARPGPNRIYQRRSTLVPRLVLIMLAIMIVRDIVIRRWTGSPAAPPDVMRGH
jgi:hypothetical protein